MRKTAFGLILILLTMPAFAAIADESPSKGWIYVNNAQVVCDSPSFEKALGTFTESGIIYAFARVRAENGAKDALGVAFSADGDVVTGYISSSGAYFLSEERCIKYLERAQADAYYLGSPDFPLENIGYRPKTKSAKRRGGKQASVSPGDPASYTHVSGDYDSTPYWAARAECPDGLLTALELGGETIGISLSKAPVGFEARFADDQTLSLETEASEGTWLLTGESMRTLSLGGVETLEIVTGDARLVLPTDGYLCGTEYDSLRSAGIGLRRIDCEITLDGGEISACARADGALFALSLNEDSPFRLFANFASAETGAAE